MMQLVQDAYTPTRSSCCGEDSCTELIFGHDLRAAECEEDAARRQFLECLLVKTCVALECVVERILMFGESRRVEDDEIVRTFTIFGFSILLLAVGTCRDAVEKSEGIVLICGVTRVIRKVETDVGIGEVDGFLRRIDRMHKLRTTTHGIERESACVAKHIKHTVTMAVLFEQLTVGTLIDKESGFLSFEPIYMKLESVFNSNIFGAATEQEPVLLSEFGLKRQCCLRLIEDVVDGIGHYGLQSLGYDMAIAMYADGVRLHHCCVPIDIDYEAREVIALAMHKPVSVVQGVGCHSDTATHIKCRLYISFVECLVDGLVGERKHAHHDAAYLEMAGGNILAIRCLHFHHLTLFRFGRDKTVYRS